MLTTSDDSRLATLFGKHVLGQLIAMRGPSGDQVIRTFSSFVCSMMGHWYVITAGHIIQRLKHEVEMGYAIEAWDGNDAYGNAEYKQSIPLGLRLADFSTFYEENGGIDLAVTRIHDFHQRALGVNGIEALDLAENFVRLAPKPLDMFYLVGLPAQRQHTRGIRSQTSILAIPVVPLVGDEINEELLRGEDRRWYGKLCGNLQLDAGISHIDRMSGGPLMGVWRSEDGQFFEYTVIGIQSGWHPSTMQIAAWPVDQIAARLAQLGDSAG